MGKYRHTKDEHLSDALARAKKKYYERVSETEEYKEAKLRNTNAWKAKNAEWYKASQNVRARKRRAAIIAKYGGRCSCCGETEMAFLAIDHINNDGAEDRRNGYGAARLHAKPADYERYQVLCHNCNQAKGARGRCPHESARTLSGPTG